MENHIKYISDDEFKQLIKRGSDFSENKDYPPLIKLCLAQTACTWLISELDPEYPDSAFGLCDLGLGFPELGSVSLTELEQTQDQFFYLERDYKFKGNYPLSVYAEAAREYSEIITASAILKKVADRLKI